MSQHPLGTSDKRKDLAAMLQEMEGFKILSKQDKEIKGGGIDLY